MKIKMLVVVMVSSLSICNVHATGMPVVDTTLNLEKSAYSFADAAASAAKLLELGAAALAVTTLAADFLIFADEMRTVAQTNEDNTSGKQQQEIIEEYDTYGGEVDSDIVSKSISALLEGDISLDTSDSEACQGSKSCEERITANATEIEHIETLSALYSEKKDRLQDLSDALANETSQQGVLRLRAAISLEQANLELLEEQTQAYYHLQNKKNLQNQQNILSIAGKQLSVLQN